MLGQQLTADDGDAQPITTASGATLVVVDPARRKLKIGSDLLQASVTEAASAGLRRLIVTYASGTVAAVVPVTR